MVKNKTISKERNRLMLNSNEEFHILQLTDLHLMDNENDAKTFCLLTKLIHNTKPDLIVITGDLTMHSNCLNLNRKLGDFLEKTNINWTYVFGNHDAEFGQTKHEIIELLSSYKNNLFEKGEDTVQGFGNYTLSVVNHLQAEVAMLFFFDSNETRTYQINGIDTWGYDYIHKNQIDWYERQVIKHKNENKKITPSLAFFHIPLPEYNFVKTSPVYDVLGEINESPCVPYENTGLFLKMKELKSTKGVFVGHDHLNDYSFVHEGILLAYGRVSGYYEYGLPGFLKGARTIILKHDGSFTTKVVLENGLI